MTAEIRVPFEEIVMEFARFVEGCEDLLPGSTALHLQRAKVEEINDYVERIKAFKYGAIYDGVEGPANTLFHYQCMLRAFQSLLKVWIKFKEGTFENAWRHLIDAYDYNAIALKAVEMPANATLNRHLAAIERALFPQFSTYLSAGFTETIGRCSVCDRSFLECDHVENQVYMGQLCRRIGQKILDINHVSLVKTPRDRRCIIQTLEDDGGRMIDRFTREAVGEERTLELGDKARRSTGMVFAFDTLDLI